MFISKFFSIFSKSVEFGALQMTSAIRTKIMPKITHCVFDLDGTLISTESLYDNAVEHILKMYGKKYPVELRMTTIGMTEANIAKKTIDCMKLPISVNAFCDIIGEYFREHGKSITLMPGADLLIRHLCDHNIPIAIASNSGKHRAQQKMESNKKFFDLFEHKIFCSDPDVRNPKPAPDLYLVAASRFEAHPKIENVLVFEDSVNGLKAAKEAGMHVVFIPDKIVPQEFRDQASVVLDSLEDFEPEFFGLPKFERVY